MKKLLGLTILLLVFSISRGFASGPPNDSQCTPDTFGILPAAPLCPVGGVAGTFAVQSGNTVLCVPDSTTPYISSCLPATALPLKDVWYSFIATDNHIQVIFTGTGTTPLSDPYIAIYEYHGDCMTLIPRDCFTGVGSGTIPHFFNGFTAGMKYYMQVASSTHMDGPFNLTLQNTRVCTDCMRNSSLEATPPPVSAAYAPDTTVSLCYTVLGYDEQFGNRLHGVVPIFGNGWDLTSLVITQNADSVDHQGHWRWFNNIVVDSVSYNGWFYDVGNDGIPTNNLGDHGDITSLWTFCLKIRTKSQAACSSGQNDLSIKYLSFADGESGSLVTTYDCSGDPPYDFQPHMNVSCCPKPVITNFINSACYSPGSGAITVKGSGTTSASGFTYTLYNSLGIIINIINSTSLPATFTNLPPDMYTLLVKNNTTLCYSDESFEIKGPIRYHLRQSAFSCGATTCFDTALVVLDAGSASVSNVKWDTFQTNLLNSPAFCHGWHYVILTDSSGCSIRDSIFLKNLPAALPNFTYTKHIYCSSEDTAVIQNFPVTAGGVFSFVVQPIGMTIDPGTGMVSFNGHFGFPVIKYTVPLPCTNTFLDTLTILQSPPPVVYPQNTAACFGQDPVFHNTTADTIRWFNLLSGAVLIGVQNPNTNFDPFAPTAPGPGTYNFLVYQNWTMNNCPSPPSVITITQSTSPGINLGPDITICPGFTAHLNAGGSGTYTWRPTTGLNDPNSMNPSANPDSTTTYVCSVREGSTGCAGVDSITVFVVASPNCGIHAYGGITPNGDGKNDFWYIDGIDGLTNDVSIFNRWGSKVWSAHNYDNKTVYWKGLDASGTPLPDGTYYYIITTTGVPAKGWVELSR
jgi:gliding motility-associated-like protein